MARNVSTSMGQKIYRSSNEDYQTLNYRNRVCAEWVTRVPKPSPFQIPAIEGTPFSHRSQPSKKKPPIAGRSVNQFDELFFDEPPLPAKPMPCQNSFMNEIIGDAARRQQPDPRHEFADHDFDFASQYRAADRATALLMPPPKPPGPAPAPAPADDTRSQYSIERNERGELEHKHLSQRPISQPVLRTSRPAAMATKNALPLPQFNYFDRNQRVHPANIHKESRSNVENRLPLPFERLPVMEEARPPRREAKKRRAIDDEPPLGDYRKQRRCEINEIDDPFIGFMTPFPDYQAYRLDSPDQQHKFNTHSNANRKSNEAQDNSDAMVRVVQSGEKVSPKGTLIYVKVKCECSQKQH